MKMSHVSEVAKPILQPRPQKTSARRECTASAKLTQDEFAHLEQRASHAGVRVGDWCREVFLLELSRHELPDIVLAEVLAIRMIVLNLLGPLARGERIGNEEFQKIVSKADGLKMKRALELAAQLRASTDGV